MKRAILAFLLFATSFICRSAEPPAKDDWSVLVNGLRARLTFGEGTVVAGTHLPEVYLELDNASDLATPMEFDFSAGRSLQFELRSADGNPAPKTTSMMEDGFVIGPFQINLPHGGTLKFPVTWRGYGIRPNFGTLLCFENALWEIPRADRTAYFLSATFKIPETPRDSRGAPRWHGIIALPAVKVPASK